MRVENEKKPVESIGIARLGFIRTGEMTETNGKKHPKSLDYFKATGDYADRFHFTFGEQPKQLSIMFLSEIEDISCNEAIEYRTKEGRLFAQGDGKNFKVWSKEKNDYVPYNTKERPNLIKEIEKATPEGKKSHILRLNFMIIGLNVLGYWTFETGAEKTSIPQILSVYDMVKVKARRVMGIIFELNIKKVKSNKPGVKSQYPVVSLVPVFNDEQRIAIESGLKQLEAPRNENNN